MQLVMTIEAIGSAIAFMPTNPADSTTPTLQVTKCRHQTHGLLDKAQQESPVHTPFITMRLLLGVQVWLQEFAWSERDHRRKLAKRRAQWGHSLQLRTSPMFCFETAIRLFYWSTLVRCS